MLHASHNKANCGRVRIRVVVDAAAVVLTVGSQKSSCARARKTRKPTFATTFLAQRKDTKEEIE
jgi:hypothetical protein